MPRDADTRQVSQDAYTGPYTRPRTRIQAAAKLRRGQTKVVGNCEGFISVFGQVIEGLTSIF